MILKKKPFVKIVEKGENAQINIFFFSHNTMFFYPIREEFHHLSHNENVVWKCFHF